VTDFVLSECPLQAVTFDLDGLMFNTEEMYQEVDRTILARHGKQSSDELLDKMMGRKALVALQIMIDWHELPMTAEELLLESREIMSRLMPARLAPMPGLMKLLDALEKADIPKGIATSSDGKTAASMLLRYQLGPRFSFVLTGDTIEHCKPAPDIYLLAAEKHGVQPKEMLVLEDSHVGSRSAVAAGAYTVAVPCGRSHAHDFTGTRLIAKSLKDKRIYQLLGLTEECPDS